MVTHCHTHFLTLHTILFVFKLLHQRKKRTSSSRLRFLCDGSAVSGIFSSMYQLSSLKKVFNSEKTPLAKLASTMFCLSGVFSHLPRSVYKGRCNDQIHRLVPYRHPIYLDFLMRPRYMIRMIEISPAVIVLSHQT